MPDSAVSQTVDELRALLREAEEALSSGEQTGEQVADLLARLRTALGESRHTFERLREEALRQARHADELVRQNPYYAVGIAAGVGALIGIVVARTCRD